VVSAAGQERFVAGQTELAALLRSLDPELRAGRFVFTTVPRVPDGLRPVALVQEDEGITLVVQQSDADRLGLGYDYVAAMLTLRVHSALDAVGLTAAVARTLAEAGISCNVVAGHFHDHVFVPVDRGAEALGLLRKLASATAKSGGRVVAPRITSPPALAQGYQGPRANVPAG